MSMLSPAAGEIDFQSVAAHELRTPLAAVLVQLEVLAGKLEGEDLELTLGALRSTRRIERLVEQLLAVSRLDAGRRREGVRVDLADVVLDVADELECVARGHRLSISADTAPVCGVRDDLHRLILNMIDNALTHTPAGTEIEVLVAADRTSATVTVQDKGPGIPPELGGRIFKRFVRGNDGSRGCGLGLAIVRELAEAHGGTVRLEHRCDQPGARFVLRLPRVGLPQRARGDRPRLQLLS
jgi:two-component system, OmpR family, sensor kinase